MSIALNTISPSPAYFDSLSDNDYKYWMDWMKLGMNVGVASSFTVCQIDTIAGSFVATFVINKDYPSVSTDKSLGHWVRRGKEEGFLS